MTRVINSLLSTLQRVIDGAKRPAGLEIGLESRSCLFVLVSFATLEILL